MTVSITKKPKASKTTESSFTKGGMAEREKAMLVSCLDLTNRAARTPIGWITDASPSMTGFTKVQLECAESMVQELRTFLATARSVMMNVVQVGTPPQATGFAEIAKFEVPTMHAPETTPLHTALERMTTDMGSLFSDFRAKGIERTDSVVIITTDGFANDTNEEELNKCIEKFLELGKTWSVTNLAVGVGSRINEPLLKKLANGLPPVRIEELNEACLMPFIQKIAERVSQKRRGEKIILELPDGMEPIE